jgi:CRISPR-associated protein Cas1
MSTLYLREQGSKLGCHGRRLVVTKEDRRLFEAPIHRFERVVLIGHVQVTSHAVALLLDHQVPLVQTTTTGRLRGILNPPDSHHVQLRKMQYRLTDEPEFADPFRRNLVTAKAGNMISVLRRYAYNHEDKTVLEHVARIKDYSATVGQRSGAESLRGVEGITAKEYFAALAKILIPRGIFFEGRNRHPATDPFNAVLSYCYVLLTNYCICAIQTTGLDVYLGFMHTAHHGGPALALDFVEQFRQPVVDRFVLALFLRKEFSDGDFQPGPNGSVYLREEPKKRLICSWEEHFQKPRRYEGKSEMVSARNLIDSYAERMEKGIKSERIPEFFRLWR